MLAIDQMDVKQLSPEDQVKLAYLCLLRRPIDEIGVAHWRVIIDEGRFDHKHLVDSLLHSPEYLMSHAAPFHDFVHKARQEWIRTLDPFTRVLDIGGSSSNVETGALIELGYPHRPREIVIFDLPEDLQYWGKPRHPQDRPYHFDWGSVRHVHGFVENIHEFEELRHRRFDCVFMGQTFEHIYPEKMDGVLDWIRDHLTLSAKFIFDTPNRDVTRLQMPGKYIDDDHKHEYTPVEAEELLCRRGFQVTKRTGLLDMPKSCLERVFNPMEAAEAQLVADSPATSYLFAFECEVV